MDLEGGVNCMCVLVSGRGIGMESELASAHDHALGACAHAICLYNNRLVN